MDNVIRVNNLSKSFKIQQHGEGLRGYLKNVFNPTYNVVTAVNSLSLDISKGDIVGFLGPNGAGKSTTIKMLTGVLKPTSGDIRINGLNPFEDRMEYLKKIGVVFGQRTQLWWTLPVVESFRMLKEIYEVSDTVFKKKMDIFNSLSEDGLMYKAVRQMSLGQRVLCDIFASVIHNPSVLFLDEPTIGLDISVKEKIYNLLRAINYEDKTTIILTSHDMHDIDEMCNNVAIIDRGKLIFNDNLKMLKLFYNANKIMDIVFEDNIDIEKSEICGVIEDTINQGKGGIIYEAENKKMHIEFNEQEVSSIKIIKRLIGKIGEDYIKDIQIADVSTDTVIRQIYERF